MDIPTFLSNLLQTQNSLEIIRCMHVQPGSGWFIEPRCHDDSLIYLILEGSCSGHLDGEVCTWAAGDLWWVAPQVTHSFTPDPGPDLDMYVLRWHLDVETWPLRTQRVEHGLACRQQFDQLIDAWHAADQLRDLRVRCALAQLCLQISSVLNQNDTSQGLNNGQRLNAQQRQRCYDFTAQHIAHDVQPEDLAHACGLQLSYFRRCFKQTFQCNPRSWLARERIRHAASLIRDAGLGVEETAIACGYASTPAFSRCFKKVMGVSPKHWC